MEKTLQLVVLVEATSAWRRYFGVWLVVTNRFFYFKVEKNFASTDGRNDYFLNSVTKTKTFIDFILRETLYASR